MKVKELIEQLQAFDPEMRVTIVDADTAWYLKITVDSLPNLVMLCSRYDDRDDLDEAE